MATLPKPSNQRQRRNTTTTAATFEAAPATRVELPDEREWHRLTLAWWDTIWKSPMAQEWVDADVPTLLLIADLVDRFWLTGDSKVAAEIRMQQREFGLTPMSRRSLQWEIKRAKAGEPAPPSSGTPAQRRSKLHVLAESRRPA